MAVAQIKELQGAVIDSLKRLMNPSREAQESAPPKALRHRLPGERASITHKFAIAGHEGYITVGLYKDGTPGELFIRMAKEGSTVSGLMDSFATAVSLALQHGVPLKLLCDKFQHTRFEPSGFTGNQEIPDCQVSDGLHLPLAGNPLRLRTAVPAVQGYDSTIGARAAVGDWPGWAGESRVGESWSAVVACARGRCRDGLYVGTIGSDCAGTPNTNYQLPSTASHRSRDLPCL